MTLYIYIESIKDDDDTAIGDLARDILDDTNITPTWGIRKIRNHFKALRVNDHIMFLLEELYIDFKNHS